MTTPTRNSAKALIIRDGNLLAVKYADSGGEYYTLPGGGQQHAETLEEALHRECIEELGVQVRNLGLRFIREYIGKDGESSWRDADIHQVEFIFECQLDDGVEPKGGHHKDLTQVDIFWIPISSISEFRFYPKALTRYLNQPIPDQIEYWGSVE
jgi:8-oxo-dGTP pyrophosphatase MutT (NUDIX family)